MNKTLPRFKETTNMGWKSRARMTEKGRRMNQTLPYNKNSPIRTSYFAKNNKKPTAPKYRSTIFSNVDKYHTRQIPRVPNRPHGESYFMSTVRGNIEKEKVSNFKRHRTVYKRKNEVSRKYQRGKDEPVPDTVNIRKPVQKLLPKESTSGAKKIEERIYTNHLKIPRRLAHTRERTWTNTMHITKPLEATSSYSKGEFRATSQVKHTIASEDAAKKKRVRNAISERKRMSNNRMMKNLERRMEEEKAFQEKSRKMRERRVRKYENLKRYYARPDHKRKKKTFKDCNKNASNRLY